MFQPAIPLSGYGGWKFLQSTYSNQLESFSDSASIKNDREYLTEKLSKPITLDDFMSDRRLMRVSMTAFDLGGEEWKGGFIRKVLEEAVTPDSSFLKRLNNPAYTSFAETFKFTDGKLSLDADKLETIGENFETASFRAAVGNVDENMRLSLNYQSKIVDIAASGSSEKTILYRLLGSVPVRTVLQTALGLPSDLTKLDIDRQADILKDKLQSKLGITNVADLASLDNVEKAIQRFHVMDTINTGSANYSPQSVALSILSGNTSGFGAVASQNLFLSQF